MTEKCAIEACYTNIQTVPTRSCFKVILELPLERMAEFFQKFGPPPPPGETKWVGMALLDKLASEEKAHAKSKVVNLAKARYDDASPMEQARTRAVLLCKDPEFQEWLLVLTEEGAANFLRNECRVDSRRQIATDKKAFEAFLKIEEEFKRETGRQTELRS